MHQAQPDWLESRPKLAIAFGCALVFFTGLAIGMAYGNADLIGKIRGTYEYRLQHAGNLKVEDAIVAPSKKCEP